MSVERGKRNLFEKLGLAAADTALLMSTTLSLVLLNRWLTGFSHISLLWISLSLTLIALVLSILDEIAKSRIPEFRPTVARLRPTGTEKGDVLLFVVGFVRILILAGLVGGVLEGAWTIWQLGQPNGEPVWRPVWFGWESTTAALMLLIDSFWMRAHPRTLVWAHQLVDWNGLSDWTGRQKWVTTAALSFVVLLYGAIYLPELPFDKIKKINESFHIQFLGITYHLPDILSIEATGFLVGLLATSVFSMVSPFAFRRTEAPIQDALQRTMRQCGAEVLGPHFHGTFELFRTVLAEKPELSEFTWTKVKERIEVLGKPGPPARLSREASFVVIGLPYDEIVLNGLLEAFFLHVRPTWRLIIFLLLLTAEVMTLFPIIVRVLVFYFPRLEEAPSTWQIWNSLAAWVQR